MRGKRIDSSGWTQRNWPLLPLSQCRLDSRTVRSREEEGVYLMRSSPRVVSAPFWVGRSSGGGGGLEAVPVDSGSVPREPVVCGRNGTFL